MTIKQFLERVQIAREGEEPNEDPKIYIDGGRNITGLAVDKNGDYIVFTDSLGLSC